jgi:hypothetical protein
MDTTYLIFIYNFLSLKAFSNSLVWFQGESCQIIQILGGFLFNCTLPKIWGSSVFPLSRDSLLIDKYQTPCRAQGLWQQMLSEHWLTDWMSEWQTSFPSPVWSHAWCNTLRWEATLTPQVNGGNVLLLDLAGILFLRSYLISSQLLNPI